MTRTGKRDFRPGLDDLEGRQLLSTVGGPFPETSPSAPAITSFRSHLYEAWRGTDNNYLNIEDVVTGHKITLSETTSAAPALTVFRGCLVVAWTGTDPRHQLNVLSSTDGVHWGNKGTLAQATTFASDGPALATDGVSTLYIVWTGTDTQLNDARSTDGKNFSPANTFGNYDHATSRYAPAAAIYNGDVVVAWTGTDNRLNYKDLLTRQGSTINETSYNAPSLARNGDLQLAWTDMNNEIRIIDVNTSRIHDTFEYSYRGPSLIYDLSGTRFLGWTGTDNGFGLTYINVDVV
jgi:hypothetical protein